MRKSKFLTKEQKMIEYVSKKATASEVASWNRKMDNVEKLLAKLTPLEQQIVQLVVEKHKQIDEIDQLRKTMVEQCIHPKTHLTHNSNNNTIACKFCNKTFSIIDSKFNNDQS